MGFLSGVLTGLIKWVLEKLGSFLIENYKTTKQRNEIDEAEKVKADSQQSIVSEIYKIQDKIAEYRAAKITVPQELIQEIVDLEEKLRDVSKRINSGFFT